MKSFTNWRLVYAVAAFCGFAVWAQQAATSTVGVVSKIDTGERQIVLKTDAGAEVTVTLPPTASFRRVAPGETDLRNAATIAMTESPPAIGCWRGASRREDQKTVTATPDRGDVEGRHRQETGVRTSRLGQARRDRSRSPRSVRRISRSACADRAAAKTLIITPGTERRDPPLRSAIRSSSRTPSRPRWPRSRPATRCARWATRARTAPK